MLGAQTCLFLLEAVSFLFSLGCCMGQLDLHLCDVVSMPDN